MGFLIREYKPFLIRSVSSVSLTPIRQELPIWYWDTTVKLMPTSETPIPDNFIKKLLLKPISPIASNIARAPMQINETKRRKLVSLATTDDLELTGLSPWSPVILYCKATRPITARSRNIINSISAMFII